ncbi:14447_t:CDS:2, partial [Funneliformis caledonium]
ITPFHFLDNKKPHVAVGECFCGFPSAGKGKSDYPVAISSEQQLSIFRTATTDDSALQQRPH